MRACVRAFRGDEGGEERACVRACVAAAADGPELDDDVTVRLLVLMVQF